MIQAPIRIVLLAALLGPAPLALAANSTNGAPPQVEKEGGIAGDPRGAIRAVGGTSQTGFKQEGGTVDVPNLDGSVGRGLTHGAPAGTTGPGAR